MALAGACLLPSVASASGGHSLSTTVRVSATVVASCDAVIEASQNRVQSSCAQAADGNQLRGMRAASLYNKPIVTTDPKTLVRTVNF
jgi:hypothetical protein